MKHQWRILIWILVLTSGFSFGMTMTQNQDFPACQQTLEQSPEAFLKSRPSNDTEQAAAGYHWATCKDKQNAQRLRGYPKLAARLKQLGELEDEFVSAQYQMASLKTGRGMSKYFLIRPTIKQHLGMLIHLTTSKTGTVTNTAIRPRYAQAKLEVESRIARVIANPQLYREPGPNPDIAVGILDFPLQFWKRHALKYQKTYRKILALIGSQRNAASLEVLEFLNTSLSAKEL
jgi:hypothetical protein